MQALNIKPVTQPQLAIQPELVNEIYEPALNQKSKPVQAQEANVLSLAKPKNLNRLLEAYSDCV